MLDRLAPLVFSGGADGCARRDPVGGGGVVFFLLPGGVALLSVVAQRSLVSRRQARTETVADQPGRERRNKFGPTGLSEFAKNTVKLIAFCVLLGVLGGQVPRMAAALHVGPGQIGALMVQMAMEFLAVVVVLALLVGAVDFFCSASIYARVSGCRTRRCATSTRITKAIPR
ncbi:MAG: EscU/YscU/HrcU family type III secretion system export apparatus switch protein [Roseovarius sp.]|nr:EscU/YscU/HrcU family type III secretion system export apparatus switch protein [Roseovarius sp.]